MAGSISRNRPKFLHTEVTNGQVSMVAHLDQPYSTDDTPMATHAPGPHHPVCVLCWHGLFCLRSRECKEQCTLQPLPGYRFTNFDRGSEGIRGLEGRKLIDTSKCSHRSWGAKGNRATETARMYPCPVGYCPNYM